MSRKLVVTMFIVAFVVAVALVLVTNSKPVVVKEVPVTVEKVVVVEKEVTREPIVIEWYSEYAGYLPRHVAIEGVEAPGDWGNYIAEMYEKENPGVDIVPQVAVYAGGGSEQLSIRLAAGKVPTVYDGFSGRVMSYSPLFLELPKPTAPFLPRALSELAHGDKLLVYPISFRGDLPVVNITLIEDAGCKVPSVQWTTTEATELAKCLADSGKGYLFAFFTQKQSSHDYQWAWISGGAKLFEDGDYSHCTFNSDYAVEYLEWEKSLLPYLPGNPSQYDVMEWVELFTLGKLAVGISGHKPRVAAAYEDGKIDKPQEFKQVNYPHLPSVEGNPLYRILGESVGVFASAVEGNDRLKEEAVKFALWLTSPDPNLSYTFVGAAGSRRDTQDAPLSPEAREVEDQFGTWGPGFGSGAFNEARTIWSEEMYEFWIDRKSAREALDDFVERYDAILTELW